MTLPIQIDKEHGIPIYVQLEEQIRLLIHQGTIAGGDLMPTVRELAVQLNVNSNTVARVYRDLKREGILDLKRGIGTFVLPGAKLQPMGKAAHNKLQREVDQLVKTAKRLNFNPIELAQMIQTRWEENS